jgi:hypothetical protein
MHSSNAVRLPASDLEGGVIDRLRAFLDDPAALLDVLAEESQSGSLESLIPATAWREAS